MAKDQSYYFSHDVDAFNDPKIVAMISEYGVIAYAWWWIIIEKLASYEDYKLPLKKYTFVALDNELGMKNEQNSTCVEHVFNKNEHVLEQNTFCSFCSFLFINALINDFELLACDDEFFWSPSLTRRFELRKTKNEEISQKRRLAGLKSGEARRKKKKIYIHIHIIATLKIKNQMNYYICLMMNHQKLIHIKTYSKFT